MGLATEMSSLGQPRVVLLLCIDYRRVAHIVWLGLQSTPSYHAVYNFLVAKGGDSVQF